jgi:O-methyltransferase
MTDNGIDIYLDLLKRVLMDRIHNDDPKRVDGRDWPAQGFTMVGQKRLDNLQYCAQQVLANNVEGDFLEAGVWRGGAAILLRGVLKAHGCETKSVWVADSFEGLPPPKPEWQADAGDTLYQYKELAISLDIVKSNFASMNLLDDQVKFIKGWFHETLYKAPVEKLSLLRLDGDMYESTYVALEALYDKVSIGGFVIVDDYGFIESCKKAVHDFLDLRKLKPAIQLIDWTGVYWQKV